MNPDFDVLLARARRCPPTERTASATGFSGWVFGLHNDSSHGTAAQNQSVLKHARFFEEQIKDFLLWSNPSKRDSDWRLEFADPLDNSAPPFLANSLTVEGEPLRCRPDVVLRNSDTGDIIVIERKVSRVLPKNVPEEGWPNLRAQLWCYRWIDNWLNAPNIFLVADIWHRHSVDGISNRNRVTQNWNGNNRILHNQMCQLFHEYGGVFSAKKA